MCIELWSYVNYIIRNEAETYFSTTAFRDFASVNTALYLAN